jgi:hypothetical protein
MPARVYFIWFVFFSDSQGTQLKGKVSATVLYHGFMVDVGADYDGLVYVHEDDWIDSVGAVLDVGDDVTVTVKRLHENAERFVFVLELDIVSPDLSGYQTQPPRDCPPVYFYAVDAVRDVEELAEELGRPVANPAFEVSGSEEPSAAGRLAGVQEAEVVEDDDDDDDEEGIIDVRLEGEGGEVEGREGEEDDQEEDF